VQEKRASEFHSLAEGQQYSDHFARSFQGISEGLRGNLCGTHEVDALTRPLIFKLEERASKREVEKLRISLAELCRARTQSSGRSNNGE
jgi:hypothetical protein